MLVRSDDESVSAAAICCICSQCSDLRDDVTDLDTIVCKALADSEMH